jgi:hypothetical protein
MMAVNGLRGFWRRYGSTRGVKRRSLSIEQHTCVTGLCLCTLYISRSCWTVGCPAHCRRCQNIGDQLVLIALMISCRPQQWNSSATTVTSERVAACRSCNRAVWVAPGALSAPERREPKVRKPPNFGARMRLGNPLSPIDSRIVGSAFE